MYAFVRVHCMRLMDPLCALARKGCGGCGAVLGASRRRVANTEAIAEPGASPTPTGRHRRTGGDAPKKNSHTINTRSTLAIGTYRNESVLIFYVANGNKRVQGQPMTNVPIGEANIDIGS